MVPAAILAFTELFDACESCRYHRSARQPSIVHSSRRADSNIHVWQTVISFTEINSFCAGTPTVKIGIQGLLTSVVDFLTCHSGNIAWAGAHAPALTGATVDSPPCPATRADGMLFVLYRSPTGGTKPGLVGECDGKMPSCTMAVTVDGIAAVDADMFALSCSMAARAASVRLGPLPPGANCNCRMTPGLCTVKPNLTRLSSSAIQSGMSQVFWQSCLQKPVRHVRSAVKPRCVSAIKTKKSLVQSRQTCLSLKSDDLSLC